MDFRGQGASKEAGTKKPASMSFIGQGRTRIESLHHIVTYDKGKSWYVKLGDKEVEIADNTLTNKIHFFSMPCNNKHTEWTKRANKEIAEGFAIIINEFNKVEETVTKEVAVRQYWSPLAPFCLVAGRIITEKDTQITEHVGKYLVTKLRFNGESFNYYKS